MSPQAPGHLLCLYFVGCAKMVSELLHRPWAQNGRYTCADDHPGHQAQTVCSHILRTAKQQWLQSAHPQQGRRSASPIAAICAPTAREKKVCQRLADQASSLRWGLSEPSHTICLYQNTQGHFPPETRGLPSLSAGRSPRQWRRCAASCEGVPALHVVRLQRSAGGVFQDLACNHTLVGEWS